MKKLNKLVKGRLAELAMYAIEDVSDYLERHNKGGNVSMAQGAYGDRESGIQVHVRYQKDWVGKDIGDIGGNHGRAS